MKMAQHNLEKKKRSRARLFLLYAAVSLFLLGLLIFTPLLFGQAQEAATEKPRGESTAQNILDIKDYDPFSKTNRRFHVSRPSFSRRLAVDGSGKYLNVTFYIQNYTTEPMDFYLFVSAYSESDLVDEEYRKWVSHTKWRKRDVYKEHFIVNKASVVPKDILPSLIWDNNDPDYAHYANLSAIRANFVSTTRPLPDVYPPMWKYLEYISHNPKTGIGFRLHGKLSPASKQAIQIDNAPTLLHERNGKAVMSKKPKPKYVMEHAARLSIVHSYHFLNFQGFQNSFNRVAIQLFEAKEVEERSASGESSKATFKKIYSVKLPP